MPINTDLSQLVFRKSIITEMYIGGLEQFKEDFEFSFFLTVNWSIITTQTTGKLKTERSKQGF